MILNTITLLRWLIRRSSPTLLSGLTLLLVATTIRSSVARSRDPETAARSVRNAATQIYISEGPRGIRMIEMCESEVAALQSRD